MTEHEAVDPTASLDPDEVSKFDPRPYLRRVSGADYLEVKWRLVWLRKDDPNAVIDSELVREGDFAKTDRNGNVAFFPGALFKARATLSTGASATGYGSETANDFGDYIEKAETKAIGRALAGLGYGTQFAPDLAEGQRIVDSPVQRPAPAQNLPANTSQLAPAGRSPQPTARYPNAPLDAQGGAVHPQAAGGPRPANGNGRPAGGPELATVAQRNYIGRLMADMGHDPQAVDFSDLTKPEASSYIEVLKSGRLPQDIADVLGIPDA